MGMSEQTSETDVCWCTHKKENHLVEFAEETTEVFDKGDLSFGWCNQCFNKDGQHLFDLTNKRKYPIRSLRLTEDVPAPQELSEVSQMKNEIYRLKQELDSKDLSRMNADCEADMEAAETEAEIAFLHQLISEGNKRQVEMVRLQARENFECQQ